MRLAFMGSPDFSVPALKSLVDAGHDIACVYSQPPRPAGRGQSKQPCAVDSAARDMGLPVRTPTTMCDADEVAAFAALNLDACIVVAFGQILPKPILDAPKWGCLNIHASLLPRWRGAAPIHRAIEAGDAKTGVTIMQMEEGLDTGPMISKQSIPIGPTDTTGHLHDRLSQLGADMIGPALDAVADGSAKVGPQDNGAATYAKKIQKSGSRIDFCETAIALDRKIRALSPWPGAWFERTDGGEKPQRVKVLLATIAAGDVNKSAGAILDEQLTLQTAEGALRPIRVQPSGKAAMDMADYLRGKPVTADTAIVSMGLDPRVRTH